MVNELYNFLKMLLTQMLNVVLDSVYRIHTKYNMNQQGLFITYHIIQESITY